jgi:hypothetical protein
LSLSVEDMDSGLLVPATLSSTGAPPGASDTQLWTPDQLDVAAASFKQFAGVYYGHPQHQPNDLIVGQPPCTPIPLLGDVPPVPSFMDEPDILDFSTLPQMQPD